MWSDYSARDAAEFVGLNESAIRHCVRAGFVAPRAGGAPLRFSFQDLLVLKLVKRLNSGGLSLRRICRQLTELSLRNPEVALSSLAITALQGQVLVRDNGHAWRPDTGQLVFEFVLDDPPGEMTEMPIRREAPVPEPVAGLTAEEWFDRAVELEEENPDQAIEAYDRSLRLRPDSTETLINIGRLYAETGRSSQATERFKRAIELDPRDATAIYNLGVVAQDDSNDSEAMALYERALTLDPNLAEAHYNLATIFDRTGDPRAAIRHINEYRKLTR